MKVDAALPTVTLPDFPDEPRFAAGPMRRRLRDAAATIIVLVLAAVVLAPMTRLGFVTDDYHIVAIAYRDVHLDDGWTVGNIVSFFKYFEIPAHSGFQLYRPMVVISFAIDYLIGGIDPFVYQVTNLLLHGFAAVMLFTLVRHLFPQLATTVLALATAVFLLSPAQLEVASWSSARSETLALIFGAAALIAKLRRRSRLVVPMILATLALVSKESGLSFFVGLALIDALGLGHPPELRPLRDRLALALRRNGGSLLVVALYFFQRYRIYGSPLPTYGHTQSSEYLTFDRIVANIVQSLGVLVAPVSEIAYPDLLVRWSLFAAFGTAVLVGLAATLLRLRRHDIKPIVLLGSIFLVTLVMSVMVNPASFKLVGTRALYVPVGMLLMFIALGAHRSRGLLRYAPLVALLGLSLVTNSPGRRVHEETSRRIDTLVDSMHEALRGREHHDFDRIAILAYREPTYFDGSYTMVSGIRAAARPPFTHDYLEVDKVSSVAGRALDGFGIDRLLERSPQRFVLVQMKGVAGARHCEFVNTGAVAPPAGQRIVRTVPASGHEFVIDLGSLDPTSPTFQFRTEGFEPHTVELQLLSGNGAPPTLAVAAKIVEVARDDAAQVFDYKIMIPAAVLDDEHVMTQEPFGWAIAVRDASGELIGRTELGLVFVTVKPAGE